MCACSYQVAKVQYEDGASQRDGDAVSTKADQPRPGVGGKARSSSASSSGEETPQCSGSFQVMLIQPKRVDFI